MQAFGRPSPAAGVEPPLRAAGDATSAAYRAEGGTAGGFGLRATTVAGVGHRLSGEENQDSYAWAHEGSRLAVAVADGLGSVSGSGPAARLAARAAVAAALDPYQDRLDEAARTAIAAARAAVVQSDGGATTLVVAVLERGVETGEVALARVGDSTCFLVSTAADAPGGREMFDAPPSGHEEVSVATPAISAGPVAEADGEPLVETASVALADGDVLAVVTDGIAGPWRDGPATVAPAMVEGLRDHPSPWELALLADFSRHGCHDDRTMVLVWLAGE